MVNGTLRACAGGIDDHVQSDSQYRAHTRKVDLQVTLNGKPLYDAKFSLRFLDNKGHGFNANGTRRIARLHKTNEPFDAAHPWKDALDLRTNDKSQVSVWVLSSDVIGKPRLQAILKPVAAPREPLKLGEIACDFAAPITFRNAPNPIDPDEEEDRGWIFDFPKLIDPSNKEKITPAKLYLKFKKFPNEGDDYTYFDSQGVKRGNWQFVNGHMMKMFVAGVKLYGNEEDETFGDGPEIFGTPEALNRYAFITPDRSSLPSPDAEPSAPPVVIAERKTAAKGETAPQVYVRAGTDINDVNTIWVDAKDLNAWEN